MVEGVKKRQALARLLKRYDQAREFVSPGEPYANLEWILGPKRDPNRDAADLDAKMIELVALWLQDLVVEVDRVSSSELTGAADESAPSAYQARRSTARSLRAAAKGFVVAFRARVLTR